MFRRYGGRSLGISGIPDCVRRKPRPGYVMPPAGQGSGATKQNFGGERIEVDCRMYLNLTMMCPFKSP
jgi:hypothetical protein